MLIYVDDTVALEFLNFFSEFKIFEKQEPSILLITYIFLSSFTSLLISASKFYNLSVRISQSRIWFYRNHQVEYLGSYKDNSVHSASTNVKFKGRKKIT